MDVSDYVNWSADETPKSIRDPWFLACFGILSGVCYEMIDTGFPEPLEIIFDDHVIFKHRIARWYPWILATIGALHDQALANVLPPNPLFKSDTEFVPLQAADMLAWWFRNAYSRTDESKEFGWLFDDLASAIPLSGYSTLYDADRMKSVSERTKRILAKITPKIIEEFKRDGMEDLL